MTTTPPDEPDATPDPQTPAPDPAATYPPPPAAAYPLPPAGAYPPPQAGPYPPSGAPMSDSDQRTWAILAHIGPILLALLAPLIIWLVFRGRGQFLEDHAKEALNFQITLAIASVVVFVLTVVSGGLLGILYLAFLAALVFMIMAAVAASKNEPYRYPVNIRFVK